MESLVYSRDSSQRHLANLLVIRAEGIPGKTLHDLKANRAEERDQYRSAKVYVYQKYVGQKF